MADVMEREYQFEAADLMAVDGWILAQPGYALLTFAPQEAKLQRDTYLDTEDWAVYRAGYSLRIRHMEAGGEATLKALSTQDAAQGRREITQTLVDGAQDGPGNDGPVAERVQLMSNGMPLRSLFLIENRRRNFLIQQGGETIAVLSLDDCRILREGVEAGTLKRVEIEATVDDGLRRVEPFVEALQAACGLTRAQGAKFEAGLAALELAPEAALDFGYAGFTADATASEYAYALLRRYFGDFLRHEPGTRLGEDVEELHDMRVATRRLRAAMSLFGTVLPPRFGLLRDELKWVGQVLGDVRDLDVYLEWLTAEREASTWQDGSALGPLIDGFSAEREQARSRLLAAMAGGRYRRVIEQMKTALRQEEGGGADAERPIGSYLYRVLRKRYRKWRREASKLEAQSDATEYHAVRIRLKKLRYGVDAARPLATKGGRLIDATKAGQDLLGEHQDCYVAISRLRSEVEARGAGLPPATVFRMGELMEQRRQRIRELRAAWPKAYDAIKGNWRPFARSLRGKADDVAVADATEEPIARPPAQRPFWLWQRFFGSGRE